MAVDLELVQTLVAGAVGGVLGAWRTGRTSTISQLDKGNTAFKDLRDENKELRDRLARLEGAFQLAVGLGAIRHPDEESQSGGG